MDPLQYMYNTILMKALYLLYCKGPILCYTIKASVILKEPYIWYTIRALYMLYYKGPFFLFASSLITGWLPEKVML